VSTLNLGSEALANLEDNLLLLFTWYTRSASKLLADQDRRTRSMDQEMIESALRQGTGISMQVRAGVRRPAEVCGFLMFYTEDKTRLRRAMRAAGLAKFVSVSTTKEPRL
jgi:hypothetical protein